MWYNDVLRLIHFLQSAQTLRGIKKTDPTFGDNVDVVCIATLSSQLVSRQHVASLHVR